MKIAVLDPFAGVAGDMFVGALIDAGASFRAVKAGVDALELDGCKLSQRKVMRCGITARKFNVRHREGHHQRGLREIRRILKAAPVSPAVRERAIAVFTRLGEAEAKVHGVKLSKVQFHEVGAVDAIADILGASIAFESLEIDQLHTRALPLFYGMVRSAHGRIPLPAPATMELMRGWPVFDSGMEGELVTPTGAALVTTWATQDAIPPFEPASIGYGAGDRDPDGHPNVCRITIGEARSQGVDGSIMQLECDVDDVSPQLLGHLAGQLLEAGALDATLGALIMKKGRPGTRITVLARNNLVPVMENLLFREGATLGIRRHVVVRTELPRKFRRVSTAYGSIRIKIGILQGKPVHVAPEYEDCRRAAEKHGVALREVTRAAMARWEA